MADHLYDWQWQCINFWKTKKGKAKIGSRPCKLLPALSAKLIALLG